MFVFPLTNTSSLSERHRHSFTLTSPPHQCVLLPRQRRRSDAAGALSARRPDRTGHPAPRPSDQHAEPRRGGVCGDHQQPHTSRLHWRQRLRQNLGHQSTRQQESRVPAGLSGTEPKFTSSPRPCHFETFKMHSTDFGSVGRATEPKLLSSFLSLCLWAK